MAGERTKGPDPDRVDQLAAAAQLLISDVEDLTKEAGGQFRTLAQRARTNRRFLWGLAISLLIDVILTVGISIQASQLSDNTNRIDQLAQRLDFSQSVTRKQVLCPLYALFEASDTPAARAAAKDKAMYDKDFAVIRAGYATLGCASFLPAPSTSPSP